jgi:hypothetical protein
MDDSWIGQKYTYEDWPDSRIIYGHTVHTPPKPPKEQVVNYGLPKKDQRFNRPDPEMVWTIHKKLVTKDKNGKQVTPLTKAEKEFIHQQWHYRESGMWFFNNGYLEYLTGSHWFYLSYWKMMVRKEYLNNLGQISHKRTFNYPNLIDSDRDNFLLWDEVVRDPKCAGLFEIGNRRDGKTYRALLKIYNHITSNFNSNCAIQSKTETDAENQFKKMVTAWTEMPIYFKPKDSGYSNPKKGLHFEPPSIFTQQDHQKKQGLNSSVKPYASGAVQLDGQGIDLVYHDEVGKTLGVDVYKRWMVVYETLVDNAYILGKAMVTTTVEEVSSENVKQVQKLWDESSKKKLNPHGRTLTGLWQYLKPAYYGYTGESEDGGTTLSFVDEYGYSNWQAAKEYLLKDRVGLEGKDLYDKMRKYAFNEQEAFRAMASDSIFMIERVFDQKDYNLTLPKGYVRQGNFIGDISMMSFKFIDDKNGPFKVSWLPHEKEQNLIIPTARGNKPGNDRLGKLGCDPYDHSQTVGKRHSKAGIHGVLDVDPMEPFNSGGIFLEYIFRQPSAPLFYSDYIAAAVNLGISGLIENQKPGLITELNRLGLNQYVYKTNVSDFTATGKPNIINGISTAGGYAREAMMASLAKYIATFVGVISEKTQIELLGVPEENVLLNFYGKFPFNDTLKQIEDFDPQDWEKSDAVVSIMLALIALEDSKRRLRRHMEPTDNDKEIRQTINNIFQTFDIRGNQSKLL